MSECPSKTQRKDDEIADNWEDVGDEQLSAQVEQKQKIIKKQKEAEEELRKLSVQDAMASGRDSPSTSSPEIPQSFKILRRPQSSSSLRQERRANKTDLSANDKLKSLQERQAAYQEARDRIFGDKSNVESCQDGNSDGRISSTPPPVERTEPPKRNTSKNHLSDVPMKEIAPVSQTWDLSHSSALTQTAYQQYLSAQGHNFQQSMVIPPRMMGISANVPQGPCYPGSSSIGINATQNTVYMPNYGYTQNHQISSLGNLQPSNQQSVPGVQTTFVRQPGTPPMSTHNQQGAASSITQNRCLFPPNGGSSGGKSRKQAQTTGMQNSLSKGGKQVNVIQRAGNGSKSKSFEHKQTPLAVYYDSTRPPPPVPNATVPPAEAYGRLPTRLPTGPPLQTTQRSTGHPQR